MGIFCFFAARRKKLPTDIKRSVGSRLFYEKRFSSASGVNSDRSDQRESERRSVRSSERSFAFVANAVPVLIAVRGDPYESAACSVTIRVTLVIVIVRSLSYVSAAGSIAVGITIVCEYVLYLAYVLTSAYVTGGIANV